MEKVVPVVKVMIDCCNLNLWANQDIVFYHHLPWREYGCALVDGIISASTSRIRGSLLSPDPVASMMSNIMSFISFP